MRRAIQLSAFFIKSVRMLSLSTLNITQDQRCGCGK